MKIFDRLPYLILMVVDSLCLITVFCLFFRMGVYKWVVFEIFFTILTFILSWVRLRRLKLSFGVSTRDFKAAKEAAKRTPNASRP